MAKREAGRWGRVVIWLVLVVAAAGAVGVGTGVLPWRVGSSTQIAQSRTIELIKPHASLGMKRRAVLVVVSDLVLVPLPPETGQVCVASKPRDPLDHRVRLLARRAFNSLAVHVERTAARRTAQRASQFELSSGRVHESFIL